MPNTAINLKMFKYVLLIEYEYKQLTVMVKVV